MVNGHSQFFWCGTDKWMLLLDVYFGLCGLIIQYCYDGMQGTPHANVSQMDHTQRMLGQEALSHEEMQPRLENGWM